MELKQKRTENFILLLASLACIGLVGISILQKWEFWVPPLIFIGTIALWIMNLSGKPYYRIREVSYLLYAMLAAFFFGVHETSFFDLAVVMSLVMVGYALFDHIYMINLLLTEYFVLVIIQLVLVLGVDGGTLSAFEIARLLLHVTVTVFIYFCCVRSITNRLESLETEKIKDEKIENYDADMEDFLSNISHELRTPVNVVNGMSELLIKKKAGDEAYSIKDAGIRLSYQIEDIQDYTECKREKLILEEEEYTSISLINDVVTSYRLGDNSNRLELVVDLDPLVPAKLKGDIKKIHKIFRHLLENAVKFTRRGGILVRMYSEKTDYGVNLCIEITDTGIGMDRKSVESVAEGMYQANKKRNRSSGGIGLGLFIVHGFAHKLGGFVKIESEKNVGTTVRVTLPQTVTDETPCLALPGKFSGNILFHVRSDKYKIPQVRDFYRVMAANLASGIRVPLFSAETVKEIDHMREKTEVSFIFMGQEEYEENAAYFDELSQGEIVVTVSANAGFRPNPGSRVIVMPKPLYAYPAIRVLTEGRDAKNLEYGDNNEKADFSGMRALIVDDEPMNLVVATSLFSDYDMQIDTALSGVEAIEKYRNEAYDVVFMDHMMPEMDGVEAMKRIKGVAEEWKKQAVVIALTANVVSGAREMFMQEGFDGFIAKPINMSDFERVMLQLFPERKRG